MLAALPQPRGTECVVIPHGLETSGAMFRARDTARRCSTGSAGADRSVLGRLVRLGVDVLLDRGGARRKARVSFPHGPERAAEQSRNPGWPIARFLKREGDEAR
jgi:hypothetical protein